MTLEEMQAAVDAMHAAMVDKGFRLPKACARIGSSEDARVYLHYADKDEAYANKCEPFSTGTMPEIIAAAHAWIAAQPTAGERRTREFQAALGRVIDLGRDAGVAVEFINPLTELAKRLSENAITDQRGVAE